MKEPQALVKNQFNLVMSNPETKVVVVKDERNGSMSTTTIPGSSDAAAYFARQRASLERQMERIDVLEQFADEYYRNL